ncbi:MAG TPA: isochorismatase family protein [Burkholderiaceae bacterium]|nr:isochorismatase family protein [Burkholderiaceae bacterium]HMY98557.1 isochorismatase family protein [Burkholderiaceae bacterium]HNB44180.1 isochorismatase family protein [Burkholderiaceae bacterium]HNG81743.1 isochorismatase family protein [Burkholderiaceae bacterium]
MPLRTALLLVDVQQSFTARPYWNAERARPFLAHCNTLIAGCVAAGLPIVRILHSDGPDAADNPFSPASGLLRPLDGLQPFEAALTVEKHRHSALVGTTLPVWLREQGIGRLIVAGIRTEQCCETTTRHASDEGWAVDFCTEATLTFDMRTPDGHLLSADQITERTATVLAGRFATVVTVAQALARAQEPGA